MKTSSRSRWIRGTIATTALLPLLLGGVVVSAAGAIDSTSTEPALQVTEAADAAPDIRQPAEPAEPVEPVVETTTDPSAIAEAPAIARVEQVAAKPRSEPDAVTAQPAAHSTERAGGGEPSAAPTVRIDVAQPPGGEAWYNDSTEVVIKATPSTAPVEAITWASTGAQSGGATVTDSRVTVKIDAQGITRLSASASDRDGNVSEDVGVVIKIDRTPPTIDVISPRAGAHRFGTPIAIDYVCADPESGIDRTNIDHCGVDFFLGGKRQGGAMTGDTWIPREEGEYEMFAHAYNNSDLSTTISLGKLRVISEDDVPPTVAVAAPTVPATGWYTEAFTARFEATDSGAGVEHVEYRTGAAGSWGEWVRVPGNWAAALVSSPGTHYFEVRALDYFGNRSETATAAFAYDGTAPTVTIASPADGLVIDQGADVEVEYSCADGVSGVSSCDGTSPSGGTLDTSEPGTFTWVVNAVDKAGNVSRSERSYTVVVPDTVPPTVTVDAPVVPDRGWYTTPPTITVTAEDPSGVAELRWRNVGPYGGVASGSATSGTFVFDGFMDGLSTISYYAVDSLGNEGSLQRMTVRVDRDAPWIEIRSPHAQANSLTAVEEFEQGEVVELDFFCGDFASGVDSCVSSTGDLLATDAVGTHTATITALDQAGHQQVESLEYTVVAPQPQPQPQAGAGDGGVAVAGSDQLASTGFNAAPLVAIALGLLLAGGVATFVACLVQRRAGRRTT